MKNDLIELYSDYLLSSFGKTTATGVAELLDNAYSHDQFTRLLSTNEFTSRSLGFASNLSYDKLKIKMAY